LSTDAKNVEPDVASLRMIARDVELAVLWGPGGRWRASVKCVLVLLSSSLASR